MDAQRGDITQALIEARSGDREAVQRCWAMIYEELRHVARHHLYHQHTLSTTDLVHEAYLKLVDQAPIHWQNRAHFFSVAAQVMRHILVDYARKRQALKRGGQQERVTLHEGLLVSNDPLDDVLALDQALTRLAALQERLSRVVECRYFGGLTEEETAEVLGVSPRTVRRDWVKAKGWLYREMHGLSQPVNTTAHHGT